MSRIYFHAPHRDAEVGGSERAYFSGVCKDIALSLLNPSNHERDFLTSRVVGPRYLDPKADDHTWATQFRTWFAVGDSIGEGSGLLVGGEVIPTSELALNTAIALNSPQLSFMAHVHGLCESHIYVEAENATWVADLIAKGRSDEVFRAGQGWEDVVALAREVARSGEGPIVLSYSVCEQFPNAEVAGWSPPEDSDESWDGWYALPAQERWDMGVRALRSSGWPFPMGPDRQDQGFLTGKSVFDLKAERWSGQLCPRGNVEVAK